jgi:GNAT superfamily N-acetyltransferase
MTLSVYSPKECSPRDIEDFVALVTAGDAVSEANARYGAAHAFHLAFARDADGTLAAVGALKQPRLTYRDRVFRDAAAPTPASRFHVELGYIAVADAFQRRGLSHSIVSALLPHAAGADIFATTRADRPAMHHTLPAAGFVRDGQPYPNNEDTYDIVLYVRLA